MDQAVREHLITRSKLDDVLQLEGDVLSIYHPTEKVAVEPEENSLHLKNLVAEGERILKGRGIRRPDIDSLLEPIETLLDDRDFWLHQWSGLAVFRSADRLMFFRTPYRVPELVELGAAPVIKPLLPSLWPSARFYVLTLSQAEVRLLHCTRYRWREVDLAPLDVPLSLAEALRFDDLQNPDDSRRQDSFHGHGEDGEGRDTQIRRWFTSLNAGLQKVLRAETAPLIVASVEYEYGLWREINDYPELLDERIDGNVELLRDEELHEQALPIIERRTRAEIDGLRERFGAGVPRDLASSDPYEILTAASDGRVDTLFLRGDQAQLGSYDAGARTVQVNYEGNSIDIPPDRPGDDLHEVAARLVIGSGGAVYVLGAEEMPADRPSAALFRYTTGARG